MRLTIAIIKVASSANSRRPSLSVIADTSRRADVLRSRTSLDDRGATWPLDRVVLLERHSGPETRRRSSSSAADRSSTAAMIWVAIAPEVAQGLVPVRPATEVDLGDRIDARACGRCR